MLKVSTKIVCDKAREYTEEGYLIAPANIARTGTMEYYGRDIGLVDAEQINKKFIVYRDSKQLFSKETMDSFENKPFVNGHKEINADNWIMKTVGFLRDIKRNDIFLASNVVVCDKLTVDEINKGKVELSAGYDSDFYAPGEKTFDYAIPGGVDFVCENIRGNHVALVQQGRAGHGCRVLDEKTGGTEMEEIKKLLEELLKLEKEEHALLKSSRDEMKTKCDELTVKHDTLTKDHEDLKKTHDSLVKAMDELKKQEETCDSILEKVSIIDEATVLFKGVEIKGKKINDVMLDTIKAKAQDCETIIKDIFGEKKLTEDGLDSELVKKAFKAIVQDAKDNGMADAFSKAGIKTVQDESKTYGQKCFEQMNVHAPKK